MNTITFSPTRINFNYTGIDPSIQNITLLSSVNHHYDNPKTRVNVNYHQAQIDWLKIFDSLNPDLINQTVNDFLIGIKIQLKTDTPIPDGNYDATINVTYFNQPETEPATIIAGGSFRAYLQVSAGVSSFTVNPTEATLHLIKSDTNNPTIELDITTPSSCSVEGSDKLLMNNNALPIIISENGTYSVGTSSTARTLPNGVYNDYALTFKNGSQQYGRLPVKLIVTSTNGLEVQPGTITFFEIKGITTTEWQNISVYDPFDDLQITAPAWARLELVSNESGFKTYAVNVSSVDLSTGVKSDLINFVSGGQTAAIRIIYELRGLFNENYIRNFHFTQDNEKLELVQSRVDQTTFAKVDLLVKFYSFNGRITEATRTLEFFYFQNRMEIDPGEIIHEMFRYNENDNHRYQNLNESSGIIPQYQFATIYFNVAEHDFNTRERYHSFVVPTQSFIKGQRPSVNGELVQGNTFLSNRINEITRITVNSLISFNFLRYSNGELKLKHNGVQIQFPNEDPFKEIPQAPDVRIYGGIIKASDISGLKENDFLEIEFAGQKLIYVVEEEGLNSVNCFYLDEHDLLQSFELTGEYVIESSYERITTTSFKNWIELTRNLSTTKTQNLKINTGYLSRENLKIIDQILMRKKAFLIIDGQTIEARPISSSLVNNSTADNLHAREVEFELINKQYDSFYL